MWKSLIVVVFVNQCVEGGKLCVYVLVGCCFAVKISPLIREIMKRELGHISKFLQMNLKFSTEFHAQGETMENVVF